MQNVSEIIPDSILEEFSKNNSTELIFMKNNIMYTQVLHPTEDTVSYIHDLITGKNIEEFIILSKTGEILYENRANAFNVSVDENYYITVTKGDKIVVMHSSNNTFITGSSKRNVNESFLHLISNDIIDYDETFKNNEFKRK